MNWTALKKVVVPIDFGELSRSALDTALQLVDDARKVHAIHVAPDIAMMTPEVVWEDMSDDSRKERIKESFRRDFTEGKYDQVELHVEFGDAGHQIAKYAESIGAELIVIPSHGRTGIERLLIGSVAERVLRFSHCPVLVLRK